MRSRLVSMGVFLLTLGAVQTSPTPILDFLDPFMSSETEKHGPDVEEGKDFGGGGALSAAGHVEGGLGNSLEFNADGSVAASKSFGEGFDPHLEDPGHEGEVHHPGQFQEPEMRDKFHQPQFQNDPHFRGPVRPLPPPPRKMMVEQKRPCAHPLPRPLAPIPSDPRFNHGPPPPPPQRVNGGPFMRKQFRGLSSKQEVEDPIDPTPTYSKMVRAINLTDPAQPDSKQGNGTNSAPAGAGFDSKAALRLARSLLDKAILSKAKNSTASSNSTQDEMTTPTGGKKVRALSPSEEEDDFEGVDVDKDGDVDEDDEDFLKHARSLLNDALSAQGTPAMVNNGSKVNSSSNTTDIHKRSIPILVLEDAKFVPLYNSSRNGSSGDPNSKENIVARSLPSSNVTQVQGDASNATQVKEETSNATKREEERPISPKMSGISHMFHNMFAG